LTNDELLGLLKKAGLVAMKKNNPVKPEKNENLVKNACFLNGAAEVQHSVYGTSTRDSKKQKLHFLQIGKCTEDSPPNSRLLHDYVKPH